MKENHIIDIRERVNVEQSKQSVYPELTKKFENIQCRTPAVVILAVSMLFLFSYTIDTIRTLFASSDYLLLLLCSIPYVLLVIVIIAFAKIEKQDLNPQALGLSLHLPKESRKSVVTFLFLSAIFGIGVLAFFAYMKFQGVDIHLIHSNRILMTWFEQGDLDGKWRTLFLLIIPYSAHVLLFSPFIEEIYFTGLIFPALRNRLGFVIGSTLTAFLFAYNHYSPFPEGQLMGFAFVFVIQVTSSFLYQTMHSLYPSIVFHFLRNMLIFSLELSAFI